MEHDEIQEAVDLAKSYWRARGMSEVRKLDSVCGDTPDPESHILGCTRPAGHQGALHVAVDVDADGRAMVLAKWRAYLPLPLRAPGTDNGNYVWVEHEPPPEKSDGGIVLPDLSPAGGFDDSPNSKVFARVVAVGPGRRIKLTPYDPAVNDSEYISRVASAWMDRRIFPELASDDSSFNPHYTRDLLWRERPGVKVGDRVVIGKHEGHALSAFGRELRCVYEHAIDGVVEE